MSVEIKERAIVDFWDLTRLVFRRWYVSVPMLLLTLGGALWTATGVEPDYIATAHVQLVPPATIQQNPVNQKTAPTSAPRNPWLDLGLPTLSAAGSVTVQDQEVIKALESADLSGNFTVTVGNQIPLVTFEVVGNSKAQATTTVNFLTRSFDQNVLALQEAYGAPKNEMISTRRLDLGNNVTASTSKVKRALVAVAGAGVLLTAALTIGLDAILRRRARKRRDDAAVAEPDPTTSDPSAPGSSRPASSTASSSVPIPKQRNGSALSGSSRPVVGEDSGLERTVIIRRPNGSPVQNGSSVHNGVPAQNGSPAPNTGQARKGQAQNGSPAPNGSSADADDEPTSATDGGKSVSPGEKTIILPTPHGSVYGRRGEDKESK
jgi:hypothetical protein